LREAEPDFIMKAQKMVVIFSNSIKIEIVLCRIKKNNFLLYVSPGSELGQDIFYFIWFNIYSGKNF